MSQRTIVHGSHFFISPSCGCAQLGTAAVDALVNAQKFGYHISVVSKDNSSLHSRWKVDRLPAYPSVPNILS